MVAKSTVFVGGFDLWTELVTGSASTTRSYYIHSSSDRKFFGAISASSASSARTFLRLDFLRLLNNEWRLPMDGSVLLRSMILGVEVDGREVGSGGDEVQWVDRVRSKSEGSRSMLLLRDAGREKIELRFIKPLALALCKKCPGAWATAAMDWCNDECDDIWANSDYSVGCVGASSRGARCIPSRESVAVARARPRRLR